MELEESKAQAINENGIYKIVMREFTKNDVKNTHSIDDTVLALQDYGISKNYIRVLFKEYIHEININSDLSGKDTKENTIFNVVLKAVEQIKATKKSDADKVLVLLNNEVSRFYIKSVITEYLQLKDTNKYTTRDDAFYFIGENEYTYDCLENVLICFEKYGIDNFMSLATAIKNDNENGSRIELILDEEEPRLIVPKDDETAIKEIFRELEFTMEYELI